MVLTNNRKSRRLGNNLHSFVGKLIVVSEAPSVKCLVSNVPLEIEEKIIET